MVSICSIRSDVAEIGAFGARARAGAKTPASSAASVRCGIRDFIRLPAGPSVGVEPTESSSPSTASPEVPGSGISEMNASPSRLSVGTIPSV